MKSFKLSKKLIMYEYEYADREKFGVEYARKDENFMALYTVWQEGMYVYIITKKSLFYSMPIAFASMIDCSNTDRRAKLLRQCFEIPKGYKGIFINDFRVATSFRGKGYGKMIANELLKEKRKYMLKAVEDGVWFWPMLGFEATNINDFFVLDRE